jgi:hypothetical protein
MRLSRVSCPTALPFCSSNLKKGPWRERRPGTRACALLRKQGSNLRACRAGKLALLRSESQGARGPVLKNLSRPKVEWGSNFWSSAP